MRARVALGGEERQFLAHIMEGAKRQVPGPVVSQHWKRFDTKMFTHNGPWGLVPAAVHGVNAIDMNIDVVTEAVQVSAWFVHLRDAFVHFVTAKLF